MLAQECIIIDEHAIKNLLDSIGYEDLKTLRKESNRKLSNIRRRDRLFFTIYLPREHVVSFQKSVDWAYEKGLIKKRTRWAFTKFAVTNIISMIEEEIKKEQSTRETEVMRQHTMVLPIYKPSDVRQD